MRKIFVLTGALFLLFGLSSCKPEDTEEILAIEPDDLITMAELDSYLFRDDVQYVDLRNFNSRYMSGYIDGFENIPFFDYLDYRAFDRNDVYEFNADQILNVREIERLFNRDKAIFLYADGCIRSAYVKDVLDYLGYERVYVLGGFYEYEGEHLIIGTGDFVFGNMFSSSYTNEEEGFTYYMYGLFNIGRKIVSIRFDIIDEDGNTLRGVDYDPMLNYNEQLTILENFITDEGVDFNELYKELSDLETSIYGDIEGYTLGYDDDLLSLIETLVVK